MLQICLALYQEYMIVICTIDCIDSIDTGGLLLLLQYLCVFLLEVLPNCIIPEINFPYHKVLPHHSPFLKRKTLNMNHNRCNLCSIFIPQCYACLAFAIIIIMLAMRGIYRRFGK